MRNTALAICVCFLIQNQRYVRIASWDIRILVVIAPNLDLCRLHVAPFIVGSEKMEPGNVHSHEVFLFEK